MPSARTCAPRCALKLGQMLHTLPDRLVLARQQNMTHADFLELVLADEHARREAKSASLRARAAGLETGMRLDTWDNTAAVRYDQQLWNELASLRFLDAPHGALLLGPVGVGKTHLACALGHIAIRRRRGVHMASAGKLFKRLKAARLDNTLDYEMRRLAAVELLILDLSRARDYPDVLFACAWKSLLGWGVWTVLTFADRDNRAVAHNPLPEERCAPREEERWARSRGPGARGPWSCSRKGSGGSC